MDKIELLNSLFGADVTVRNGRVAVIRDTSLASAAMDRLVRAAVFGEDLEKEHARWLIWEIGQAVGVRPASIQELYLARGRGQIARVHRPGDQRARHVVRYGAFDLQDGNQDERGRVHPRNRALGDRVYRSAPVRVRRGHACRSAP